MEPKLKTLKDLSGKIVGRSGLNVEKTDDKMICRIDKIILEEKLEGIEAGEKSERNKILKIIDEWFENEKIGTELRLGLSAPNSKRISDLDIFNLKSQLQNHNI
jgi:hypothetical protein